MYKILLFALTTWACCECVYVYSSFWAPLFNPRLLNYRVDAKFDPDAGVDAREAYQSRYGTRGGKLIADLGDGRGLDNSAGPADNTQEVYGDVRFHSTYPGSNNKVADYPHS